jgi:hypothetical protein
LYLNIVESKNRDTGGFDRQSVIVFADDLAAFLGEFDKSLKVLEKAVRGKKHGTRHADNEDHVRAKDGGKTRDGLQGGHSKHERKDSEGGRRRVVVRRGQKAP